jgi:hypothetical protein
MLLQIHQDGFISRLNRTGVDREISRFSNKWVLPSNICTTPRFLPISSARWARLDFCSPQLLLYYFWFCAQIRMFFLTRQVQWHQHESPAPPARNFTANPDKPRFVLSINHEFISKANKYDEYKDILSYFISLHFKDCKFITGLKGGSIDAAIYISVHYFWAILVFVLDTKLCDKELWHHISVTTSASSKKCLHKGSCYICWLYIEFVVCAVHKTVVVTAEINQRIVPPQKGSPVHVAATCARRVRGSIQSLCVFCKQLFPAFFCKRLFSGFWPMTTLSLDNRFTQW